MLATRFRSADDPRNSNENSKGYTLSTTTAPVLTDLIPASRVKDAALVMGGTALLAVTSQILVPLWFTPVPLSLATFSVLLVGAALGPLRGGLSMGLYLVLGLAGVPVFAGFSSGAASASFGYILGYVLAGIAVGFLARRAADRRVLSAFAMAVVGSALIYAVGVPWLMISLGVGLREGLMLGLVPFLVGDAIKAVLASAVLPAAWKLVGGAPR